MAEKMTPDELRNYISLHRELTAQLARERDLALSLNDFNEARVKLSQIALENERTLNILKENRNDLDEEGKKLLDSLEKSQKNLVSQTTKEYEQRRKILNVLNDINSSLRVGWKYLMDSDKVIKSTILNLGMSGAKAEMMRSSFENSAQFVARLGGELKDVQTIMEGYADTTGRARALSEETVKSVMAIGRGTGLGVEEATRLASQFEFMGRDATATLEYVQGVVDTSERMGVNTSKVLKDVSANFKKLSTFTFQAGTRAFAQMAIDAERTRVSMETALNVAEATRGLEAVIELGANLQVMGGEFAKMDPLHWMYTVRNEPEQLNQMISDMTKGLFTLREASDGTFERFISPADRDRLANVAKSLGISNEEMFQIAQRSAELSSIQRDMSRLGLSDRERQLVEGAAQFSSETGRMYVRIGRHIHDVRDLTRQQAQAFASEQKLLEDRAREALTFDETFRATINELKASLLPLLEWVNDILRRVRPVFETIGNYFNWFSQNLGALGAALSGAQLLVAAVALKGAGRAVSHSIKEAVVRLFSAKKATAATTGMSPSAAGMVTTKTGKPNIGATKARDVGMARRMQAAGGRNIRTGAGIGAAGLGIGAGIGAGAMGIAELAKATKDMDVEKLQQLNITLGILGVTMVGLGVAGAFATVGAKGLLAVGAAALGIGAGIGLAAAGIGYMAEGLGNMIEKARGGELRNIAGGLVAIAGASMLFANPLNLLGLTTLTATMGVIAATNISAAHAAKNIENMATSMSGTRDDFLAVERAVTAINSMDRRNANIFSDLAKIMSQPLKVEFADSNAVFRSDVTLEIDKSKFMNKIFDAKIAAISQERTRINKS